MGWLNTLLNGRGMGVEELAARLRLEPAVLRSIKPAYTVFKVPKRSGGKRVLFAPSDELKAVQRTILRRLLSKLKAHPAALGFEHGQSIVTHARRHSGKEVVVKMDIINFFPKTQTKRVEAYFRKIGWNRPATKLLVRLTTFKGGLPQGAPTSPRLSNLVNYSLDTCMAWLAKKLGGDYSRYADDMTVSFPGVPGEGIDFLSTPRGGPRPRTAYNLHKRRTIAALILATQWAVRVARYRIHTGRKLQVRRRNRRQTVTGLVVNERPALPRETRRKLRAVEHHLATGRPATMTPEQLAGWKALNKMIETQRTAPPPHRPGPRLIVD